MCRQQNLNKSEICYISIFPFCHWKTWMQPVFHGSVPCFPSAATLQSVFQRASLCLWCFFRLLRITGRLPKLSPSCAVRSWEVLFFSRLSHPNSSGITSGRRTFPLLKCRASFLIEERGISQEEFSLWENSERWWKQILLCQHHLQTHSSPAAYSTYPISTAVADFIFSGQKQSLHTWKLPNYSKIIQCPQ